MKRYGNLFEQICSFENLVAAAYRARRAKRFRPDVAAFHYDLERHVVGLREELISGEYRPGAYRAFRIRDPKPRLISAAPYRDRVVHHAVCRVIEPVFDRTFIEDSYANREGKGSHKALDRCTHFTRRHGYALKCDIEKYFPSIDHEILLRILGRKIKCRGTMRLLETIVAASNEQDPAVRYFPGDDLLTPTWRRRGIPIGNLTSQFFCNAYLNGFDHFVKESLGCRAYLRFADDFVVFSDDKKWLGGLLSAMQEFLNRLRLRMHPTKCHVVPTRCAVDFLGWAVYRDHRRLRRRTGVRIHRGLRRLQEEYAAGVVTREDVRASVMSWIGHLRHGNTWGLRRRMFGSLHFARESTQGGR